MSDAQKLMSRVHLVHTPTGAEGRVTCWCNERFPSFAEHSDHVAAEVDKALGGLTRIWSVAGDCSIAPDENCDHFGEHGPWTCEAEAESREEAEAFLIARRPDAHIESRWVSGWTVTE